ncbi:hypothetical protein [Verrucosispora sioxanthis]|nr:hypothetical protein [Verrucosispora sioxanthis]
MTGRSGMSTAARAAAAGRGAGPGRIGARLVGYAATAVGRRL